MKRTITTLLAFAVALAGFGYSPALAATCTNYTVQPGDNLFRIGLKYGASVASIQAANGLSSVFIYSGQVLCIPTGSGTVVVTPKPGTTTTPVPSTPATNPGTYTVQPGDNLYRISLKFGTTVFAIQQLNGLTSTFIFAGQVLRIPGAPGSNPTPVPTATTPAPAGTPATPAPTSAPSGDIPATYVVKSGDTLWALALKFNTSIIAIQGLNGLTSSFIYVGQVLKIPGGSGGSVVTATTPAPAATATTAPGTATPPPATAPAGNSNFELGGQVNAFSANAETKMKYSGMYWVKRQLRWAPSSKSSDFFGLITEAHNRGFKILLSVLGDPGFAVSGNFSTYASFVGDLAGAGADGIEIWNEMNLDREWPSGSISPANYVPLLQKSYQAIKAKNANTLVISGAPSPTGFFGGCSTAGCDDKPYVEGMVAAGALNYLDCLGVHYNEGVVSPTQTSGDPRGNPNFYSRYYQTMVDTYYTAEGGARKLCFTELGYLSGQEWGTVPAGFLWKPPFNLTVAEQAQYLGQAAQMSKDQGKVRLMIVFNVDFTTYSSDPQAGYAIIRPNNTCPACDSLRGVTGGR